MKLREWEGFLDKNTHKMSKDTFFTRWGPGHLGGNRGWEGHSQGAGRHKWAERRDGQSRYEGIALPPPQHLGPGGVRRRGYPTISVQRHCSTLQIACRTPAISIVPFHR